MPRGRRRPPHTHPSPVEQQSFLGNHSLDEITEAATPPQFRKENEPTDASPLIEGTATEVFDEPTLGDLQTGMDGNPARYLVSPDDPRIMVSDAPFPGQTPDPADVGTGAFIPLGAAAARVVAAAGQAAAREGPPPAATPVKVRQGVGTVYRQRIQVLEVFRYPGHLKGAPEWVNRNWIAFFQYDEAAPARAPGPGLRVPGVGDVHIGDFLVQQEVLLSEGLADVRLAVYTPDEFFRWFLPIENRP